MLIIPAFISLYTHIFAGLVKESLDLRSIQVNSLMLLVGGLSDRPNEGVTQLATPDASIQL